MNISVENKTLKATESLQPTLFERKFGSTSFVLEAYCSPNRKEVYHYNIIPIDNDLDTKGWIEDDIVYYIHDDFFEQCFTKNEKGVFKVVAKIDLKMVLSSSDYYNGDEYESQFEVKEVMSANKCKNLAQLKTIYLTYINPQKLIDLKDKSEDKFYASLEKLIPDKAPAKTVHFDIESTNHHGEPVLRMGNQTFSIENPSKFSDVKKKNTLKR